MSSRTSFLSFLLFLISTKSLSTGTVLTAMILGTRLPYPNNCTRPYHLPGEDVITLFGSCREYPNENKDILRFRMSTDTIEKVNIIHNQFIFNTHFMEICYKFKPNLILNSYK